WRLISGGGTALLALLAAFSVHQSGDGDPSRADVPVTVKPAATKSTAMPSPSIPSAVGSAARESSRAESFAEMLGRAARGIGEPGQALRERVEGLQAAYKLLKALGMSDADIARLVADQGRQLLAQELEERTLTAADARRVIDNVQETVVRAAQDVDER